MSQKILTQDGPGIVREIVSSRGNTSYRVQGNGFSGWYASHEILSDLSEDETTTAIPFTHDEPDDSTMVPHDDPHAEQGVTLPWNPKPTEEWDGELTQQADGADISLKPTKSTVDGNFDEDPESSTQVFGKMSVITWHDKGQTQGTTSSGHHVDVYHTPTSIDWSFSDNKGNEAHHDSHSAAYGQGLSDNDYHTAYSRIDEAAEDLNHAHVAMKRSAFNQYTALLDSDSMIREAAWADVRRKATRLFRGGDVKVELNTGREIRAQVKGDSDTYQTQVHRKNAFGDGITYWDCDCEWGKHAYLRQRTFIGRQCSHALATYWAMQAKQLPPSKNTRINDRTERHSLASGNFIDQQQHADAQSDPNSYYDDGSHDGIEDPHGFGAPKIAPSGPAANSDPWQAGQAPLGKDELDAQLGGGDSSKYVRHSARNADGYIEDEYVPYVRRESKAVREGGLMVWDDDLAKVMKQIYNQPPPASAGDPGAIPGAPDQSAQGVPGGLGMDPSQMGADPSGNPMSADPSQGDPAGAVDPTQGDPMGAGVDPASATPPYVRNVTGPTAPDPTGNTVTSNYPRRTSRTHFAEFTDGNPDNDFEEWGAPNSEDADTFNTVQDMHDEEEDDTEDYYDNFYGKSSAIDPDLSFHYADAPLTPDQFTGGDQFPTQGQPSANDPAPGQDLNTPATPASSLPMVPRNVPQGGFQGYSVREQLVIPHDSNDTHENPYIPAAEEAFKSERQGIQHPYIPKIFRDAPAKEGSLEWLREGDSSWEKDPKVEDEDDSEEYADGDEDYENDESDHDGKTSSLEALAGWFEDDNMSTYSNVKEAEDFNDNSDEIVQEFQRSAAARQLTGGRHFTFAEQDELINEPGEASQLGQLNLKNSFYEDN